jgi:hypothetical protein
MKKVVMSVLLAAIIIGLSGCVVAIGNKGNDSKGHHACKSKEAISSTIAEIDAVNKLHTEQSRLNVYMAIAQRPYLSPKERTHLIDAGMKYLHTEKSRESLLMALAANPTPCHEPKPEPKDEEVKEEAKEETEK